MTVANPEIALNIRAAGIETNYHDQGSGFPVLFIHGSGPGVSAFANWRLVLPELAKSHRVIAPDMVGFGFTDRPEGVKYDVDTWVAQAIGLLDALGVAKAHIVGNSFGGAIALALAIRHPERVERLVLMGSVGVPFPITPGLDAVWGYQPSFENMRKLLDIFAYSRDLVNDELAELRYQASIRPGFQESFLGHVPGAAPALGRRHGQPRSRHPRPAPRDADHSRPRRQGDSPVEFPHFARVDRPLAIARLQPLRPLGADRTCAAFRAIARWLFRRSQVLIGTLEWHCAVQSGVSGMKIDLTGKTAVVTGSTSGIGFAIAQGLALSGARVILNGRADDRVRAAVSRLVDRESDADVSGVTADLATASGVEKFLAAVGGADILVNNLGIFEPKPFLEIPDADWLRFFETNVLSGVRMSRAFLPKMLERNWGRIVFISSESALNTPPEMVHYGMTKTAQLAVSRGLAEMTAGSGVTVNSVLPGPTRSEGVADFFGKMAADAGVSQR